MSDCDIKKTEWTLAADEPEPPRVVKAALRGLFDDGYQCGKADGIAIGATIAVIVSAIIALMIP